MARPQDCTVPTPKPSSSAAPSSIQSLAANATTTMPAANEKNAGIITGCGPTRSKARPVKGRVMNMARA